MNPFFVRRHPVEGRHDFYWYEILERVKYHPLSASIERRIAVGDNETMCDLIVEELNKQRRLGIIEGMERFAWWRDGEQMVGTCGTTLKRAIEDLDKELQR